MTARGEGFSRWTVRVLALVGAVLVALGAFGWWLSTRVLEAEGFADVAAKASQHEEVRDYIADQATLRLARTSNFVSAARPVVSDAISAAVATPPVERAVHDFVTRAHQQVFQARGARRVDVNAQEAAVTIRSALQTINPALAKKLPASVLDATASVSQSGTVDLLFRSSRWVEDLYLPSFLVGVGLFILAMVKARDRVRAIRTVGVTLAVAGALLLGVGAATPAFATVAGTADPLRGDAVATFIYVLTGRLVAAGQAFFVFGILLALAPGHDGGDLHDRVARVRTWFAEKRTRPRWRFAGGIVLMVLALCVVTVPEKVLHYSLLLAAGIALYIGIVVCLRAAGLLTTDHSIPKLHKRQLVGVFAAVIVSAGFTATIAVGLVAERHRPTARQPDQPGLQRLHRALRATVEPDRVAGQPQRDVVGRLQLPRRRAHHHHPRAAERGRPLPDDRRLLRLRRQRPRAHEPRRRREPRTTPRRSAARKQSTSSTGSARSRVSPTPRARSRTSTSATTSASSARSPPARSSPTSTPSSRATSPTSSSSTSRTTCSRRT